MKSANKINIDMDHRTINDPRKLERTISQKHYKGNVMNQILFDIIDKDEGDPLNLTKKKSFKNNFMNDFLDLGKI